MIALRRGERPILIFEHDNQPLHRTDLLSHIGRRAADWQCVQCMLRGIEHVALIHFAQQTFFEHGEKALQIRLFQFDGNAH